MIEFTFSRINLQFAFPGGTSRGILTEKPSYFIKLSNSKTGSYGFGECSLIPGLSPDNEKDLLQELQRLKERTWSIEELDIMMFPNLPSLQFGLETARRDLLSNSDGILFPSDFTSGNRSICINGLIWMGTIDEMKIRIKEKLSQGFKCLKLKIGALDFESEITLLRSIRKEFGSNDLIIRVDANGGFNPVDALEKLKKLSELNIHSIEQPIMAGQIDKMAELCIHSPIPIALDEELIGIESFDDKDKLISKIKPQYIIIKPSLLGGFKHSDEWIEISKKSGADWWATSALESNIGLNAIAQWSFTKAKNTIHGLGTGKVFTENINSFLNLDGDQLSIEPNKKWDYSLIGL